MRRPAKAGRLLIVLALTGTTWSPRPSGGFLPVSLALLADSGHMLGRRLGLGMAIGRFASPRPPTAGKPTASTGAEILAALVNSVCPAGVESWIIYAAWQRWHEASPHIEARPDAADRRGRAAGHLIGVLLLRPAAESLNVRGAFLEVLTICWGPSAPSLPRSSSC